MILLLRILAGSVTSLGACMGASLGIFKVHVKQAWHTYHSASACRILFVQIGPSATEWWRHTHFSRWQEWHRISTFGFSFLDFAHLGRSKSSCIPNWGETPIHGRDYYFRFLKTNVRCVGILLPVSIFTFASPSACPSTSVYQISSKSDHPRCSYNVISIFRDGDHQQYCYLMITADHPQSANEGLRSVLKFRLDRIYSFGDIAFFVLWGFGLKIYTCRTKG